LKQHPKDAFRFGNSPMRAVPSRQIHEIYRR
jgi:hypothetical protein